MSDPFLIEGPAVISFSGGRTSGYMLRRILDVGLRPDVHVLFANTGKERPETLDFIRDVSERWGVVVRWVEWMPEAPKFREVTYHTAARDGEPFSALISSRQMLPNPVMRYCTQHLKIDAKKRFVEQVLGLDDFTNVLGIRYDEPRRWLILGQDERNGREFKIGPLVEAKVTKEHVNAYWAASPFDLQLRQDEGNCDLCFLKGLKKKQQIVRDRPDLAAWWITQEQRRSGRFRKDHPSYAAMASQADLFKDGQIDDEALTECYCHD